MCCKIPSCIQKWPALDTDTYFNKKIAACHKYANAKFGWSL